MLTSWSTWLLAGHWGSSEAHTASSILIWTLPTQQDFVNSAPLLSWGFMLKWTYTSTSVKHSLSLPSHRGQLHSCPPQQNSPAQPTLLASLETSAVESPLYYCFQLINSFPARILRAQNSINACNFWFLSAPFKNHQGGTASPEDRPEEPRSGLQAWWLSEPVLVWPLAQPGCSLPLSIEPVGYVAFGNTFKQNIQL